MPVRSSSGLPTRCHAADHRGFTLVELMITLTVLAAVMVLTRKLDWYGVGRLPLASSASPASDL